MEEGSGLRGGLFSNLSPGILGLEMPTQQGHKPHQFDHQQMVGFARPETEMKQRGSDDEEAEGKRKGSPWHRMKWSDGMVRLLIMAVYYMGDECGSEGNDASLGKKTQKKGKWKSVSKAMMEKGFYVSPQQCEDKFNDLNKRYKRVNEILGKGTACRVVENQRLLDQMDHLSGKSKEEVRKLLNSKHLFFREMCAYHNSCGDNVNRHMSQNEEEEEECWDKEEEEGECWEDEDEEEEECWEVEGRKREGGEETTSFEKLKVKVRVGEEGGREWMRMRVEEERVGQEMEAYEIEKERVKWVKYSGKKEREMERRRLRNEREKLECDRMVLLLKRKEIELMMTTNI